MTTLIDFFETITGMTLNMDNDVTAALVIIFGFFIVYDIIHIVFSSPFGFVNKK